MKKGLICILSGLTVSSCAFAPQERFIKSAYDYNIVVEQTQNQMLLVNVVRASDRRPMYFSAITIMRGGLQTELGSGTVGIPFGSGSTRATAANPSVKYTASPSFDVVPLDSKNFNRGILSPVPFETFVYYWNQGWPREVLLHLFIQAIEVEGVRYENYPTREEDLKNFQKLAREIFCSSGSDPNKCKLAFEPEDDIVDTQATITTATLKEVIEMDKANLRLVKQDGVLKLAAKKKSTHIKGPPIAECVARMRSSNLDAKGCTPKIYLRSPEAMLYYLGEILRVQLLESKTRPTIRICAPPVGATGVEAPLFVAEKNPSGDKRSIIAVVYEGDNYIIPWEGGSDATGCTKSRSMHALSLISQLIGQNKDIADLPTTGAVTVVGPR